MTETMDIAELLTTYTTGDEGDWDEEFTWLKLNHGEYLDDLRNDIQMLGVQNPVLLGPDGRVWDGHHRICAAVDLGFEEIPVEYA